MTYNEYLEYEEKVWSEVIAPFLIKYSNGPFVAIDIGCSAAISLLTLYKFNLLSKGYGVEPRWEMLDEKYLNKLNYSYKDKNIEKLDVDGLDCSIPYSGADLLIKTFNKSIRWEDILKRSSPNFIISDINEPILDFNYELLGKVKGKYSNTYLIYRKSDRY